MNIANIFNSIEGIRAVLHGGDSFGIFINDENQGHSPSKWTTEDRQIQNGRILKNNTLDLGVIERESLSMDFSLSSGLDSYDQNVTRVLHIPVSLEYIDLSKGSIKSKTKVSLPLSTSPNAGYHPSRFEVIKCDILPSGSSEFDPIYSINFESIINGNVVALTPGSLERFVINIHIQNNFEGSIGKWIVFTFKALDTSSLTAVTETTFVMALRLKGSVISASSRPKLSFDAPNFVPTFLSAYFDASFPVCNTLQLPEAKRKQYAFTPPTIFQAIIDHSKDIGGVPTSLMIQAYIEMTTSNKFTSFLKRYLHLSNNSMTPVTSSNEHSHILLALNCAEELQMSKDILKYDLYYQKILFLPVDNKIGAQSDAIVVKARFLVKGMREARPRITIGDIIRLRPAEEDIITLISADRIPRHNSEFQGIVIWCSVKTEEVECQFLISRHSLRDPVQVMPTSQYRIPIQQILFECNKIRYHMRFTFKREGFALISDSIHNILQDETFVDILSPDFFLDLRLLIPSDYESSLESLIGKESYNDRSGDFSWNAEQLIAIQAISVNLWNAAKFNMTQAVRKTPLNSIQKLHERRRTRLPPFIIQGCHGTGKTALLVESIRRVKELHSTKRILVCASSNNGADDLCNRLSKYFTNKQMLRLNWWQRSTESVQPPELLSYCLLDSRGIFDMPASAALMSATKVKVLSFDIVVTTCVCAGALRHYSDLSGKLFFDLVVVDDVNEATEGEAMVPISLCSPSGVIVLAGDTKQLGPQMRSPLYNLKDLGQSLQERLLALPLYQQNASHQQTLSIDVVSPRQFNSTFISNTSMGMTTVDSPLGSPSLRSLASTPSSSSRDVRSLFSLDSKPNSFRLDSLEQIAEMPSSFCVNLRKNYRSNYHMLQVPNSLFYQGELEACADDLKVSKYLSSSMLPPKSICPMLFIGVNGQHYTAMESFYNVHEACKVVETIKCLLNDPNLSVNACDIGVIGGFRSQVLKIRELLVAEGLSSVSVGGTEDFQGTEKDVIIISTVLSNRVANIEKIGCSGLIGDDKQFNVAVTRAIGLCIAIGNPSFLHSDRNWKMYIEYCDRFNCCIGYPCYMLRSSGVLRGDDGDILNIAAQGALVCEDLDAIDAQDVNIVSRDSPWRSIL